MNISGKLQDVQRFECLGTGAALCRNLEPLRVDDGFQVEKRTVE
jgi:hypothetical protein